MDLANLMNPQITFSKTTMDDILARYSVKAAASASTTNKAPASVKTQLSSLLQAKARVQGDRSDDDFGDLTWLTLENLHKPSKWPTARPLFDGAAHPDASVNASVPLEPGTVRKNLENLRSVLYAAARHVQTLGLADTEKDRLLAAYDAAYQEMGQLAHEMLDSEQKRLATRDPSGRQQAKWVPLPDLRRAMRQVVQYLENLQRAPPASMSIFELKKMQRAMQFCLYMLIPPVRNNYAGLRFVFVCASGAVLSSSIAYSSDRWSVSSVLDEFKYFRLVFAGILWMAIILRPVWNPPLEDPMALVVYPVNFAKCSVLPISHSGGCVNFSPRHSSSVDFSTGISSRPSGKCENTFG